MKGIAVDPRDGRIWIADDDGDRVISVDPDSAGPIRTEVTFLNDAAPPPDGVSFHTPCLRFSPDGVRLVVSDVANGGWLWIFERD